MHTRTCSQIDCTQIVKVEEKEYRKTTIPMQGLEITLKNVGTTVFWCYAEDARTLKGIWLRAIQKHIAHGKHTKHSKK